MSRTAAQGEPIEIGVRSSVVDKSYVWSHAKDKIPGEGGHGRVYGIFKVSLIPAPEYLVKKVDEKYVTGVLMSELDANGFREFKKGERPDILITASYGRGELANPYIPDTGEVGGVAGSVAQSQLLSEAQGTQRGYGSFSLFGNAPGPSSWTQPITSDSAAPSRTIVDAGELYADKEFGHEANLQKASFEKLFIRVTAWETPKAGEKHPRMLWKTIMVVDDPDHRDLNEVAATMLHAGAPMFDKLTKQKEVFVNTTLPEGHIKLGTPEVVGSELGRETK